MSLLRKLAPLLILAAIAAATVAVLVMRDSGEVSGGPSRVAPEIAGGTADTP